MQQLLGGLRDETNGNPFFALEILRYLASTGDVLQNASGRWEPRVGLDLAELPESVREVVAARVAARRPRRDDDARDRGADRQRVRARSARSGARTPTRTPSSTCSSRPSRPGSSRSSATTASRSRTRSSRTRWPRTSASSAAPRCTGGSPRSSSSDDVDERNAGELARHWLAARGADAPDRALRYAELAGDRALAGLAPDDAVPWYRTALDLVGDDDPAHRVQLHGEPRRRAPPGRRRVPPRGAARRRAGPRWSSASTTRSCAPRSRTSAAGRATPAPSTPSAWRCSRPRSPRSATRRPRRAPGCSRCSRPSSRSATTWTGAASCATRRSRSPASSTTRVRSARCCRAASTRCGCPRPPRSATARPPRTSRSPSRFDDPIARWFAVTDRLTVRRRARAARRRRPLPRRGGRARRRAPGVPALDRARAPGLARVGRRPLRRLRVVQRPGARRSGSTPVSPTRSCSTPPGCSCCATRRAAGTSSSRRWSRASPRTPTSPGSGRASPRATPETGRHDDARRMLDAEAATGFESVPRDVVWATALCLFGNVAATVGATDAAAVLLDQLRPVRAPRRDRRRARVPADRARGRAAGDAARTTRGRGVAPPGRGPRPTLRRTGVARRGAAGAERAHR